MLSRKALAIASLCTIVCAQAHSADDKFKSAEFLTWSPESQRSYITTAATAASVIVAANVRDQAKCIDDWGIKYREGFYQPVIEAMKKLPDYHPMAVTIAVLEKACGDFKYR
ncbi:hypothetical protein [Hyphomicrobium sp.]|uniref:hypothetical protein n=1 Tax=Hyphomicrobium sp. TaxID=82 RepID=UPI0025BD2B8C|nr:hypothetical protein [Hyphomicrobium sp.]MCC7253880.1 hypothetical protein [Hyphomicrobium sp.]